MSKITINNRSSSSQSKKKRLNTEELNCISKKKVKRSIDVTSHWKKLQAIYESNTTKVFECKSKDDCKEHLI
jgi:hypothetical protein